MATLCTEATCEGQAWLDKTRIMSWMLADREFAVLKRLQEDNLFWREGRVQQQLLAEFRQALRRSIECSED